MSVINEEKFRKNKYFNILYEEGMTDEPEEEIPEENILPYDEEAHKDSVQKLTKSVLYTIAGLAALEVLIVLFFVYGFVNDWTHGKWQAIVGLIVGSAYGALWFMMIVWQTESLLMPEETHHKGKLKLGAVARYALLVGLGALGYFTGWFNPLLMVIGAFNMKLSSYLQPLLQKKAMRT